MLDTIAELQPVPRISKLETLYGALFTKNPLEILEVQRLQKLYGNVFINSSALLPNVYNVCGSNEIAHIYQHPDKYIKKFPAHSLFAKAFGSGFINQNGVKSLSRKKNILTFFKLNNLKNYLQEMNSVLDFFITQIKQDIRTQKTPKVVIDLEKYSTSICLEIAFQIFFQRGLGSDVEMIGEIIKSLNSSYMITPINAKQYMQNKKRILFLKNFIKNFVTHNDPSASNNLISLLKNYTADRSSQYEDINDIVDEIFTLLVTGHETSAISVTFALALLQISKPYKNLVLEEINNLTSDSLTYEDLQSCVYTKMWIEETLRMYPPIWRTLRYSVEHDAVGNYYLPAKSYVLSNIYVLHRNPEYWPNPDYFNPFRFSPDNKHNIHKNSYMPFIIGQRGCVASNFALLEVQLIVIKLLRHLNLSWISGSKVELAPYVSLRMKDNLQMYVESKD